MRRTRAFVAALVLLGSAVALVFATSAPAHSATARAASTPAVDCPNENTPVTAANLAQGRMAVLCLVNQLRAEYGLPAVADSPQLDASAQGHSDEMVAKRYLSHISPSGSTPITRDAAAGFHGTVWGENIAAGQVTPYGVMTLWMSDVPHCSTVLSPTFREIGLGITVGSAVAGVPGDTDTWTQDFGLLAGQSPASSDTMPAASCPHPLAPHMAPPAGRHTAPLAPVLVAANLTAAKGTVSLRLACVVAQRCVLKISVRLVGASAGAATATVHVRIAPHKTKTVRLAINAAALRCELASFNPSGYVTIDVTAPTAGMLSGVTPITKAR